MHLLVRVPTVKNYINCFSLLFILICIISLASAHAQSYQPVSFRRYSVSDGLSNNITYAIVQDHLGYMWFGTDDGLNRFDGYTYKHYKYNTTDSASLSNSTIRCLFVDSHNNIWIGTDAGLNVFDPVFGTFKHYLNSPTRKNSISNNFISAVCEGADGKIYVGTNGGGLNILNPKTGIFTTYDGIDAPKVINALTAGNDGTIWIATGDKGFLSLDPHSNKYVSYRHSETNNNSLSEDEVTCLYVDSQNTLWIGTLNGGLNEFDVVKKSFTHYTNDPQVSGSLSQNSVFAIVEDQSKQLWVGTLGNGLNLFNRYTKRFTPYQYNVNDRSSLSNNKVWCLYVNRGGTLWVGTNRGINSYSRSRIKFSTIKVDRSEDQTFANNNVYAITEDNAGNLWVGTFGGGVTQIDPLSGLTKSSYRYNPFSPTGLSSDIVTCILFDGKLFWIGTDNGLNLLNPVTNDVIIYKHNVNTNSLSSDYITSLAIGKNDVIWIGTKGGGLNKYDSGKFSVIKIGSDNKSISNNIINCVYADAAGTVWVGTEDGLNRITPNDLVTVYKNDANNPTSISHNQITNITSDSNGTIWIGTNGGGVNALTNLRSGQFTRYSEKNHLTDVTVLGLLVDDQTTVWASTSRGIMNLRLTTEDNVVRIYDDRDGLQYRYNQGACLKSKNGLLYFGGNDGYNIINPSKINLNTNQPNTVINSIKIFNDEYKSDTAVYLKRHIELDYTQNSITFEFAALDYVLPEKNKYMYKLEGFSDEWNEVDTRRYATYTNLDDGTYTFYIQGTNNDGISKAAATILTIVITPPFWKTWWFRIAAVLLTITAVYGFFLYRTRSLRRSNQLLEEKVEHRTQELKEEKEKVEHKSVELEKTLRHLKDTQTQLIQSEKMASLGQLTAGIAHEIKNPLNFVNNFAQLSSEIIDEIDESNDLVEKSELMADLKKNLEKINHHGKRADSIVQSMLQHSRGAVGEKQEVDINKLCDEYMDLAFHGMRATNTNFNCAIVKNFDPSLPKANAVPQEMSRVVLNLLNNAFYAVKETKDAKVEVSTNHNSNFIKIKVRDNGVGMADDIKEKIFEPFFTTKPTGEGTGLGLSLSFDIVKSHGGEITVESEAGKGSEFVVLIPLESES